MSAIYDSNSRRAKPVVTVDGAGSVVGNTAGTALASAARTATVSSADIDNHSGRYLTVFIDVTAVDATPSVTVDIEGKSNTGGYYSILTSAALTGTGKTRLRVGPGIAASANVAASDLLPRVFRITATHADADSITYSIDYSIGV